MFGIIKGWLKTSKKTTKLRQNQRDPNFKIRLNLNIGI
jgi:hypothetical protein